MILNLDKQPREAIAAKDSEGNVLSYGDIIDFSHCLRKELPERSLLFLLTENNVGGIAWTGVSLRGMCRFFSMLISKESFSINFSTYIAPPTFVCLLRWPHSLALKL